jgi:hypothetical protein
LADPGCYTALFYPLKYAIDFSDEINAIFYANNFLTSLKEAVSYEKNISEQWQEGIDPISPSRHCIGIWIMPARSAGIEANKYGAISHR